jgi:predicted dehydrogenase
MARRRSTLDVLRVGIAGSGFGARVHAPILAAHPGFEPVAIASLHRGDADRVRAESGIANVMDNWHDLIDLPLDLLVVAANPELHREITEAALQAGLHVLCEKPMALDLVEAESMESLRRAQDRIGAITFEFRFRPARAAVRGLIADGAIGRILHVSYAGQDRRLAQLHSAPLGWLGRRSQGGGRLGALGSHMFDSLRYWTGDEVAELTAQLTTHVAEGPAGERRDADDAFQVVGRLVSGATFLLDYRSATTRPSGWQLEVHGSEGTLALSDDRTVRLQRGDGDWREVELPEAREAPGLPDTASGYASAMLPFLDRLHRSVVAGRPSGDLPTFQDGVESQRLLDAARRASDTGRRQTLRGPAGEVLRP